MYEFHELTREVMSKL